ncbi:MAG: hypothetical protein IPK63_23690 [Candidatus Competibacteraceae bacterium]|nr:hypothetical protein [Candidatus Competibacteraceae bacterium]
MRAASALAGLNNRQNVPPVSWLMPVVHMAAALAHRLDRSGRQPPHHQTWRVATSQGQSLRGIRGRAALGGKAQEAVRGDSR